ncbi:protein of unknown function [Pseudomonas sp. JV551A1]|nr:protein of unknown function [Pseudomonas sp. JV551A1]
MTQGGNVAHALLLFSFSGAALGWRHRVGSEGVEAGLGQLHRRAGHVLQGTAFGVDADAEQGFPALGIRHRHVRVEADRRPVALGAAHGLGSGTQVSAGHLADHLLKVAQAALGIGTVGDLLAQAQLWVEEVVGVQQPAVFSRQDQRCARGAQFDAGRARAAVLAGEHCQHGRGTDPRRPGKLDGLLDAAGFLQQTPGDGVHRHTTTVVVTGVVEDIEVQAEARAVHTKLCKHAELAEQLDVHAALGVQRQHQAVGAQAVMPIPGLQGLRCTCTTGCMHGGRAFAVAGSGRQHFGAGVQTRQLPQRQFGTAGHADHFSGQARAPGLQGGQAVFADALRLTQRHAYPRKKVQVQCSGGTDLLGEARTCLVASLEGVADVADMGVDLQGGELLVQAGVVRQVPLA